MQGADMILRAQKHSDSLPMSRSVDTALGVVSKTEICCFASSRHRGVHGAGKPVWKSVDRRQGSIPYCEINRAANAACKTPVGAPFVGPPTTRHDNSPTRPKTE